MKKILLIIICFLSCIFSIQAQTLYGTTLNGGADGGGTIIKLIPGTNTLTVAKSFETFGQLPFYTNLIQASNGKLYGMTASGGRFEGGIIFSYDPSSSVYTRLKEFDIVNGAGPEGSLMQATDGKLYGMTFSGGNGGGVIFSFDPSTSTYTNLRNFDLAGGQSPHGSLIQASDGKLYGVTGYAGAINFGTIFSFDPVTSIYTKLKDLDGTTGFGTLGSLVQASDGKLYGMTSNSEVTEGGVIFSFDPSTSTFTKRKEFDNTNGGQPRGSLIQASDGKLYGMTTRGANTPGGVIFSFDPNTSNYTKLKDFGGSDGYLPFGDLMQANDGKLYGMTNGGGTFGYGVIFSFDPSGLTYTKLNDFNNTDGGNPQGSLMQAGNGKLYGMTSTKGLGNGGVIFSFDLSSSSYAKLKDFGVTEGGSNITGGLLRANDGKLYGMTINGGSRGLGTLFSFNPSTSAFTKLKDFDSASGINPCGRLIQGSDGKLYGMTTRGGINDRGVIFSFDPSTSAYTKQDFNSLNGSTPDGSLMQASDGKFYGMTQYGDPGGPDHPEPLGVMFSYDASTSTITVVQYFNYGTGINPHGSLIQASDGKLYGMTGQSGNVGVIFSFDLSSSTLTVVKGFNNTDDGASPHGSLIQANDGKLYGMTAFGGSNLYGVIFSFDPVTLTYTKLKDFDNTNGAYPYGNLMQASDGKLYGMSNKAGSHGAGTIFSFDPSTSTFTKLQDFDYNNGANPYLESGFIEITGCTADTTFYKDADGDGYGNPADSIVACTQPAGFVANNTDCDDDPANGGIAVHPGATEVCNGIDDNCDGQVDEGLVFTTYYPDADGDGYGTGAGQSLCKDPGAGYATKGGDCDDTNPAIHPGAVEICDNAIDDNCNGQVDENCNGEPLITINDVSVDESKGVAVLTVTLSHTTSKPVWLLYFTKDGTAIGWGRNKDYKARFGLLVIRPGELAATIPIKIIKDNIAEPTEYFDVVLLTSLNGTIADRYGRVFISDEMLITNSKTEYKQNVQTTLANRVEIKVMPNPATYQFNLTVKSNNITDKINMKVIDAQGKLIETRSGLNAGQTLRIGSNYRPGTYLIQATQGKQRRTVPVVKLSE